MNIEPSVEPKSCKNIFAQVSVDNILRMFFAFPLVPAGRGRDQEQLSHKLSYAYN